MFSLQLHGGWFKFRLVQGTIKKLKSIETECSSKVIFKRLLKSWLSLQSKKLLLNNNIMIIFFSVLAVSRQPQKRFHQRRPTLTMTTFTTRKAAKIFNSFFNDARNNFKDCHHLFRDDGEKRPNITATKVMTLL